MIEVLRNWREIFFACGVSSRDVDLIAPAILPECFFFEKSPN
jgi:serine/threonine-protein kinase HipA